MPPPPRPSSFCSLCPRPHPPAHLSVCLSPVVFFFVSGVVVERVRDASDTLLRLKVLKANGVFCSRQKDPIMPLFDSDWTGGKGSSVNG